MSSFFHRQSDPSEAKKRGAAAATTSGGTTTPIFDRMLPSDESGDNAPESWVELAPSRASLCSSVEAAMMDDANGSSNGVLTGGDLSVNKDSRLSPVSMQSPHADFEPTLEQVKYRLTKDVLPKSTDWIWDWSSRPEAFPPPSQSNSAQPASGPHSRGAPHYSQLHHSLNSVNASAAHPRHSPSAYPSSSCGGGTAAGQIGSALTTPPNSPEPDLWMTRSAFGFGGAVASRRKKPTFASLFARFEVLVGLVVSNLVTFVLGATIGFCICKKLVKNSSGSGNADSVFRLNYHYW